MNEESKNTTLRNLPSVRELLDDKRISNLIETVGRPAAKAAVRGALDGIRKSYAAGETPPQDVESIVELASRFASSIAGRSMRPVINGTGILLHTNLSRAPLGDKVIDEIAESLRGYTNLEFDLHTARRGHRTDHAREILKFLTCAEDVAVVNNNAAGIMLSLSTFAAGKEVIVSRGELVEIGGSFRIPDVMAASGAIMVEVGSTNRTRLSDYENAIGPNTGMIFKAHKSNYTITGFTEEVSVKDLATLAHNHDLPMMYDIGSGLLRRPANLNLGDEPDVARSVKDGADLVSFSCDKLLGGPQGGVIAGSSPLISAMARAPMMRALRVGKLTYVALIAACRQYLADDSLLAHNPTFFMLERSHEERKHLAETLLSCLKSRRVESRIVDSTGRCGGGTLPETTINSLAVEILPQNSIGDKKRSFADIVFHRLLETDRPLLGVLREGRLLVDVFALNEKELEAASDSILLAIQKGGEL